MKLKETFFLLSVITVVFLAGCAKQPSVATAGVVIEKFASQISAVPSNSPVEFTLIVKNTGEREAQDVKAVLGGLTFLPTGISEGSEEGQKYWKLGSTETILKPSDPGNLIGEDVQSGFKGDKSIVTWRLTAPIQVRDQTYEPTVNLVYSYSTVSTILIKAVDFNYFQSLPETEQQKTDTGVIVSKTTKGPIEVSVKTDQAIISGSSTLPIEIEFKNIGGGRTFLGGGRETSSAELYSNIKKVGEGVGLDKILVELPPDMRCSLKSTENPQNKNKIYEVRLIEGKNGRILCNKVIGGITTIQTSSMDIKVNYRYLIEGKTAIKVSKTLYQPPIVDISLLDSTVDIIHNHLAKTTSAKLDFKIKNIGNQPISGTEIKIDYAVETKTDIATILPSTETLDSFRTKPVPTPIEVPDIRTEIGAQITYDLVTVPPKLTRSQQILADETNDANNKKSDTIILDYDIAIKDLKARLANPTVPNDPSVEITANVKNNGKTVDGIFIPFTLLVNKKGDEISCSKGENKILIDIERGKDKDVVCIYKNSQQKLSFNIQASVDESVLDSNHDNDKLTKEFDIKYDIAILAGSSKGRFLEGTSDNKVVYELSTVVVNKGEIIAKNLEVDFKDGSNTLCSSLPARIEKLDPGKQANAIFCRSNPLSVDSTKVNSFPAVASVSEIPTEDRTNNKENFKFTFFYDIFPDDIKAKMRVRVPVEFRTFDIDATYKYDERSSIPSVSGTMIHLSTRPLQKLGEESLPEKLPDFSHCSSLQLPFTFKPGDSGAVSCPLDTSPEVKGQAFGPTYKTFEIKLSITPSPLPALENSGNNEKCKILNARGEPGVEFTLKDSNCRGQEIEVPTTNPLPVLVLKYFPVDSTGNTLDKSITGLDTDLSTMRVQVNNLVQDGVTKLTEGTKYHGYKASAEPSISYFVFDSKEFLSPIPVSSNKAINKENIFRPGYMKILNDVNICDYVDNKGVKQVWLLGYQFGNIEPDESNMAMGTDSKSFWGGGSYGDISNSEKTNDMPTCQKTYTLYGYNYARDVGSFLESHMHQIEITFRFVDEQLASKFISPYGEKQPTGNHCGWAHAPPNTKTDYDWRNEDDVLSDCEDWKPDGSGPYKVVDCHTWYGPFCLDDTGAKFKVWWMQNVPGKDNKLVYNDKSMRNWWEFYRDFDLALKIGKSFVS